MWNIFNSLNFISIIAPPPPYVTLVFPHQSVLLALHTLLHTPVTYPPLLRTRAPALHTLLHTLLHTPPRLRRSLAW